MCRASLGLFLAPCLWRSHANQHNISFLEGIFFTANHATKNLLRLTREGCPPRRNREAEKEREEGRE